MKSEGTGTERTKQNLINAAGTLAAEQGLSNVSTRAVAKISGENIGSIHYHFGSKDGLFKAMIDEAMVSGQPDEASLLEQLNRSEDLSPQDLSKIIRSVIAENIKSLFRSGQPDWHVQVIYQLIQREDDLFEIFNEKYLSPKLAFMDRLIRSIKPNLSDEEVFLHSCLIKLPIYAQASYMNALLRQLKVPAYSDDYLEKFEDLLTRQTLLLLELPLD
ncbi:TetR/AcrR family transcriptional regulator [Kiritimatiellota bacterium B12222]|nr:TetR/AcrR family transcriptional regulator [Kiritimatiellota bacterium B12222]